MIRPIAPRRTRARSWAARTWRKVVGGGGAGIGGQYGIE
jgi:hypothetical protein